MLPELVSHISGFIMKSTVAVPAFWTSDSISLPDCLPMLAKNRGFSALGTLAAKTPSASMNFGFSSSVSLS